MKMMGMVMIVSALVLFCGCEQKEAKNGNVKTTVHVETEKSTIIKGGAWIINKSGRSDILRGLQINLLKKEVLPKELQAEYKRILLLRLEILESCFSKSESTREVGLKVCRERKDKIANAESFADFTKLSESQPSMDLHGLFNDLLLPEPSQAKYFITKFMETPRVCQTATDIDGKYEMTIKGAHSGDYYIYAESKNDVFYVRWIVPLKISDGAIINVNLDNSNAFIITK